MRRPLLLILLLLLLLGGVVGALLFLDPDEPAPASGPGASPVARASGGPGGEVPTNTRAPQDPPRKRADEAAAAQSPRDGVAPSASSPDAPDGNPLVDVKVRVLQTNGLPAEGAVVTLRPWDAKVTARVSAKTDADGRAVLQSRRKPGFLLLAEWNDFAASTPWILRDDDGPGEVSRELTLKPAVRVRGKVVDPDGAGVEGALVRVSFASRDAWMIDTSVSETTGAGGAFEFPALAEPPGAKLNVDAKARGFVPHTSTSETKVLGDPLVVRLDRGAVVRGRCVDEKGVVVADAEVAVDGRPVGEGVRTGADGRFEIGGVGDWEQTLIVRKDGFAVTPVRELKTDVRELDVGDVLLRVGGTIRGVVLDAEEKPADGATVELRLEGLDRAIASFVTDESGAFLFRHVAPEGHLLAATEGGVGNGWSAKRRATLSGVLPDAGEARIVLTGALGVRLTFLKESDRTPVRVGSAQLRATGVGATSRNVMWSWMGPDAAIDAVRFEVEDAGSYRIELTIPGYEPAVIDRADVLPDRELRIDVLFREPPK